MWIRTTLGVLAAVLLLVLLTAKARVTFDVDHEEAQAAVEADRDEEMVLDRRFSVDEGDQLDVRVGDADVAVMPGTSDAVHVQIFVEGRDLERARDYYEKQNFRVEQQGRTVSIRTSPDRNTRFQFRDWRDHPKIIIKITTPERFDAEIHTADGDLSVERLDGRVAIRTSDGDVHAGYLSGSAVSLRTSDGDVRLQRADAATVEIQTSDGDLAIDEVVAERLTARTSDGDVRIARLAIDGAAQVQTSDGDLVLDAVSAETFTARTSDGEIRIEELIAGRSTLQTSDGEIVVRRLEGALEATGGDTDMSIGLYKPADLRLRTSDGDIVITAPEDFSAVLSLRAEEVRVDSEFAFQGTVEEERAEGTINGGGTRLEARANGGSVVLRAR